jgi:hypothetical protein
VEPISKEWLNEKFAHVERQLDDNAKLARAALDKLAEHNLRIDRLEVAKTQAEKNRNWIRSFGPSIFGAFFGALGGWFVK